MAEEEPKKLETETPTEPPPPPSTEPAAPAAAKPPKDVADDKTVIPSPPAEDKPEESKALAVVDKAPEAEPPTGEKSTEGSVNRDAVLARVETEKRISLIKAWEESEKSKAENNFLKTSGQHRIFSVYKRYMGKDFFDSKRRACE
ncbi:hypothetical protein WN944_024909 [Citrus x changshan-huyou]|uniref:Remorin N-terminal domain-containing protein n=1 Tax=Citrus x changshan-huyou TaxID=2935761 RepID=A0AAP0LV43_9ROSI